MSDPPLPTDHRTKFQVERIAFFSDAVFAIAITLMVIEVRPPRLPENADTREAVMALLEMLPQFFGVLLSFFLIAVFWHRHHQLMRHVGNYDGRMIRLNFLLLASVVLLPFSTGFDTENFMAPTALPFILYNLNCIAASFFTYRLFTHVLDERNGLSGTAWPGDTRWLRGELLYPIAIFTLIIALSFIHPGIAAPFYALLGLEKPILRKVLGKPSPEGDATADRAG
jgi:uncharacterized membrane protein